MTLAHVMTAAHVMTSVHDTELSCDSIVAQNKNSSSSSRWKLTIDTMIDEVKAALKMTPVEIVNILESEDHKHAAIALSGDASDIELESEIFQYASGFPMDGGKITYGGAHHMFIERPGQITGFLRRHLKQM